MIDPMHLFRDLLDTLKLALRPQVIPVHQAQWGPWQKILYLDELGLREKEDTR